MKGAFRKALAAPVKERGFGLSPQASEQVATVGFNGNQATLKHGSVLIAAITSCTNTSNPSVMLGAGLLAKKAADRGLRVRFRQNQPGAGLQGGDRVLEGSGIH